MKKAPDAADVDEYIANVPEPGRSVLSEMRALIRAAAPKQATETISYQMPAFRYKGVLVYYAAFREHCSLFAANGTLTAKYAEELKPYVTGKGTIRFDFGKPLPATLIRKLVKARAAENDLKKTTS